MQGTAHPWRLTASVLWPLQGFRALKVVRIKAGFLCLDGLGETGKCNRYPGLMYAKKVVILASECSLNVPGYMSKWRHVTLKVSGKLHLSIQNSVRFVQQIETLDISCGELLGHDIHHLHTLMRAASKVLHVTDRRTGHRFGYRILGPLQSVGPDGSAGLSPSRWPDETICCCHACEACLHWDGVAEFAEEARRDLADFPEST